MTPDDTRVVYRVSGFVLQQWRRQEEDPVRLQRRLSERRSAPDPTQGLLETEDLPEGRVTHEQAVRIHATCRCGNTIPRVESSWRITGTVNMIRLFHIENEC